MVDAGKTIECDTTRASDELVCGLIEQKVAVKVKESMRDGCASSEIVGAR